MQFGRRYRRPLLFRTMRILLVSLCCAVALAGHAQSNSPHTVPAKAVLQLENMRRQTEAEVVVGRNTEDVPAEARPDLNRVLLQSATDFLLITTRKPTKEAYLQSLDKGLAQIGPLAPKAADRQQLAEYFQDLLDIVGLESSEGRLTAFVKGGAKK